MDWKKYPIIKGFDCVEMMHAGADKIRESMTGLSLDRQLDLLHQGYDKLMEHREVVVREAQAEYECGNEQ